jgi:hypothetical protein
LRSHGSPVEEEQVTGHAPGGSLQILACADGGRAALPVEEEQQQSGRRGQKRLRGGAAASPTGEVAGSPIEREAREAWMDRDFARGGESRLTGGCAVGKG